MPDVQIEKCVVENINIYRDVETKESNTDVVVTKLKTSQKEALNVICKKHNISVSEYMREAAFVCLDLIPNLRKMKKHRRLLRSLLDNLT